MSVRPRLFASGIVTLALAACSSTLDSGEVGTLRYAGRAKGVTPLPILPPVSDTMGNVYVLNGAIGLPETNVFVGPVGGGWKANCSLTKGDAIGAHGWVGYAQNRQWYWSGAALVRVSGIDGGCSRVLDRDPATNSDLLFQGIIPAVRNLAQRTTVPALVQSPTDLTPFSALVDLETEILTNVQSFDPADAEDVQVIGTGGLREDQRGAMLVQFRQGGRAFLELRMYDGDANLTERIPVSGGPFATYAVQGYLQLDDSDLVAGAVQSTEGEMLLFTADAAGGDVRPITGMEAVGVHRWQGALWLVGTANDTPVIAEVGRGGIGPVLRWDASLAVQAAFEGVVNVRDDRSLPSRETLWNDVRTAAGPFPFVGPHGLTEHAPDTTLWTFAGPAVTDSALKLTSFGVAPCGVTYP